MELSQVVESIAIARWWFEWSCQPARAVLRTHGPALFLDRGPVSGVTAAAHSPSGTVFGVGPAPVRSAEPTLLRLTTSWRGRPSIALLDRFVGLVDDAVGQVVNRWGYGGEPWGQFDFWTSVTVPMVASQDVLDAIQRWGRGCRQGPAHRGVFCSCDDWTLARRSLRLPEGWQ